MMLRWSTQRANDRYKDHLDGRLTRNRGTKAQKSSHNISKKCVIIFRKASKKLWVNLEIFKQFDTVWIVLKSCMEWNYTDSFESRPGNLRSSGSIWTVMDLCEKLTILLKYLDSFEIVRSLEISRQCWKRLENLKFAENIQTKIQSWKYWVS